jgi:heme-degrading monooxygenase HmoA
MITRIWHGYTTHQNADSYETLLRSEVLPGIHRVAGFLGAELLRREFDEETEFVTLTYFDSLEAVKAFAGEDYELAVIPTEARKLLSHFDERSAHYASILRIS